MRIFFVLQAEEPSAQAGLVQLTPNVQAFGQVPEFVAARVLGCKEDTAASGTLRRDPLRVLRSVSGRELVSWMSTSNLKNWTVLQHFLCFSCLLFLPVPDIPRATVLRASARPVAGGGRGDGRAVCFQRCSDFLRHFNR